jgi:hypothetical protein
MHPHTKFGVPSYQGSGDMTHCMFSKMATWRPCWNAGAKKKCIFQYTTPNRTYSIKLVIVALCLTTDARTTWKQIYTNFLRKCRYKKVCQSANCENQLRKAVSGRLCSLNTYQTPPGRNPNSDTGYSDDHPLTLPLRKHHISFEDRHPSTPHKLGWSSGTYHEL